MRTMLLGFAASIAAGLLVSAPAQAKEPFVGFPDAKPNPGFAVSGGVDVGIGSGFPGHRFDRRRRRGDVDVSTGIWVNGGEWARYNNRSFESDSYNDWWHDQPWRSQPAWVRNNQDCQRQYWSGGGWRC